MTDIINANETTIAGHSFSLPGGSRIGGVLAKEVILSEMTGQDEENISRPNVRNNGGKIITTLLLNCVKSIGGIKPTVEIIRDLLVGDRDFLMLKLREISLGPTANLKVKCECKNTFGVSFEIKDIEIRNSENPFLPYPFKLAKGYTDDKGVVHADGEMRLPTGVEQEYLSSDEASNGGAATTAILTKCCVRLGKLVAVSTGIIRALTFGDRMTMAKVLSDNMPGPVMELRCQCPRCDREFIQAINTAELFSLR